MGKISKKDAIKFKNDIITLLEKEYPFAENMNVNTVHEKLIYQYNIKLNNGALLEINFMPISDIGSCLIGLFPLLIGENERDYISKERQDFFNVSSTGKHNFFYSKEEINSKDYLIDFIEHIDRIIDRMSDYYSKTY